MEPPSLGAAGDVLRRRVRQLPAQGPGVAVGIERGVGSGSTNEHDLVIGEQDLGREGVLPDVGLAGLLELYGHAHERTVHQVYGLAVSVESYDELILHMAWLGPHLWWALMRPVAIRCLVQEIDLGVLAYVEEDRLLWEEFPTEMDILLRMDLERQAIIRAV